LHPVSPRRLYVTLLAGETEVMAHFRGTDEWY